MRSVVITALLLLSGCCLSPERQPELPAEPAVPPVTEASEPEVGPAQPSLSISAAEATEGFIVCRRDGDVRIIGVRELSGGKCLLVYDNRLSGSGTQNTLEDLQACELQQQRMQKNFVRSGFSCE